MILDLNSMIYPAIDYVSNEVIPKALGGDVATIAMIGVALIVLFVLVVLLVELTAWVVGLLKRFVLFVLVMVSIVFFFFSFSDKIFSPEPDFTLLAIGAAGVVCAIIALAISVISVKREMQKPWYQKVQDLKKKMKEAAAEEFEKELEKKTAVAATPAPAATQVQQPGMLSKQALTTANVLAAFHDRSLLAVLSYMVVAEFGVFSGVTVSAPNETVGLIFFGLFIVAAMIFIKSTYHSYLTGIKHLTIALVFGAALSVLLGYIWASIPLEELLSLGYFKTNSLVALVTGLAVSLFLGSKA
ncbi:MAG: hypothetical protein JW744_03045 [Candidatus Diapherotrites archaeon]|uniref:Uncharacterized protein n=1 Tax=Candidatus Iainarchaeum sp. TaxID=3101447 RepID=A0A938YWI8_9ARCH|nr:hypothetical protein [Candidatus Diapherotrites archaeon]